MSETYLGRIEKAAANLEQACGRADIGLILGSGLGDYAETLQGRRSLAIRTSRLSPPRWRAMREYGTPGELMGKRVCSARSVSRL